MPGIYDEEKEKLKRPKWPTGDKVAPLIRPAPIGGTPTAAHAPTRGQARGAAALPGGEFFREGMREAAADPTVAGRLGKSARTLITAPVVAGYEAMRGPVAKTAEAAGAATRFAGDIGSELFRTGQERPKVSAPATPPPEVQDTKPEVPVLRAGYDTPEQEVDPTRTKQVQYGGLMRPVREEQAAAPVMRLPERLSDVAMPESIGDITRYKLERGAKKFDIDQQQKQKQKQAVLQAGEGTEDIAKQELELKREAQEQRAGKEGRAEAAVKQQQAQLEAAQQAYQEADTLEAKIAAAQRVNMLSGRGVRAPKAAPDKTMSQKEASDAQQSAQREYTERTGSTEGFFEEFFQTNPVAFKANYGNLAPADVSQYNQIISMLDADLAKQAGVAGMTPDEFRNEAYRRYKEAGGK